MFFSQQLEKLETIHLGHVEIENDDLRSRSSGEQLDGFISRLRLDDLDVGTLNQVRLDDGMNPCRVVDDK